VVDHLRWAVRSVIVRVRGPTKPAVPVAIESDCPFLLVRYRYLRDHTIEIALKTFRIVPQHTMADVEKSIKNGGYSPSEDDRMETLDKLRTASSINMSPELFEKLYLSPQNMVKGDLRKTFGNPTPMYGNLASPLLLMTQD
jgi:hypothetical protein